MDEDRRAPAAAAASVAAVLGGDDLLREILQRLDFPHYLVRAALVSKQWLLHASDPAFLSCFRERHPPSLLGFCIGYPVGTTFVPLPQPLELAALSRRGRGTQKLMHYRNGCLALGHGRFKYSVLAPLLAQESKLVLPPDLLPFGSVFLPEDGGRNDITLVRFSFVGRQVRANVHSLESGEWGVPATAVIKIESRYPKPFFQDLLPPIHGKIFVVTKFGYTLVLDLTTPRFIILELPNGVESNFMLSCAPNSGLYLVNVEGFQIRVWFHEMADDNYGACSWLLVDTFCIHEACARIAGDIWPDNVRIVAVGDNADVVFLDHPASGVVFYCHLRSKVLDKVYHKMTDRQTLHRLEISPIMMFWPPIFPPRNVEHGQEE